jgi:hypothetical protein
MINKTSSLPFGEVRDGPPHGILWAHAGASEAGTPSEEGMNGMLRASWNLFRAGGWAPLLVFGAHAFASRVLHLYQAWPPADIPMHFSGGVAVAFFASRCFGMLPRERVKRDRIILLELVLIVSLTCIAAVFWEFAEFATDQLLGTNVQISLANTMQDLAMGISGAMAFGVVRSRQLRVRSEDVREFATDLARGLAA